MRISKFLLIWAPALLGFSLATEKHCFFDHKADGLVSDGLINRALERLRDDCTIVPSVNLLGVGQFIPDPNATLPEVVDLKNIRALDKGDFSVSRAPNLTTVIAKKLGALIAQSDTCIFSLDFLPKLETIEVAPDGIRAENLTLDIQDTLLETIPEFSATTLRALNIRDNPKMKSLQMVNVEIAEEIWIWDNGPLTISLPNLQTIARAGTYVSPVVTEDPDASSNIYDFILGENVSDFGADKLSSINTNAYLNGTLLETFDFPMATITGAAVFKGNEKLKSIKLGAPIASPQRNFTFVLLDNPLLKNVNFGSIFTTPSSTRHRKRADRFEFLGDVFLNGPIDSIDTTGFHFSGTFKVSTSSTKFDCDKFKNSLSIDGDGYSCESDPEITTTDFSSTSSSPTTSATATSSQEAAEAAAAQRHHNIVLAATIPAVLVVFFFSLTAFFLIRRHRIQHREAAPTPPGPEGHVSPGPDSFPMHSRGHGVTRPDSTYRIYTPSNSDAVYYHPPPAVADDTPEHYYRSFNTPSPTTRGRLKQSTNDSHDEIQVISNEPQGYYGRAVTTSTPADVISQHSAIKEEANKREFENRSTAEDNHHAAAAAYAEQNIQAWLASEDLPMTIDRGQGSKKTPSKRRRSIRHLKTWRDKDIEEFYGVPKLPPEQKMRIENSRVVKVGGSSEIYGSPVRMESFKKKPLPSVPMPELLPRPPPLPQGHAQARR